MPSFRRRSSAGAYEALRERHLLLVPTFASRDDVDGLVRCWYPETDLAGSGSAELAGAGTLSGPHELSTDAAVSADVPTPWTVAYDLDVPQSRSYERPGRRPDGLHRCFPDGLPVGPELAGVELLVALARRLGGAVRCVGAREALTPEAATALDMRVVSPTWVRPADVAALCRQEGDDVELAIGGELVDETLATGHPDGTPFVVQLGLGPAGAVGVHGAVAELPEPAAAGEAFAAGPMATYDVRWHPLEVDWLLAETLDGLALACRERARPAIGALTRGLAELGGGIILDADGFLVDRYQV